MAFERVSGVVEATILRFCSSRWPSESWMRNPYVFHGSLQFSATHWSSARRSHRLPILRPSASETTR